MQGTGTNELAPVEVRKIAAAFGTLLSDTRTIDSDGADPMSERIVLAADGRMIATQMTFAVRRRGRAALVRCRCHRAHRRDRAGRGCGD